MDFIGKFLDHIRKQLQGIKPFSWQVSLLLSLFSWFTYLLIREPAVKQFVSIFGWFFLILGLDWALIKEDFTIPGLQIKFKYGPWITGALASCAFWSNHFIIQDGAGALISWPIFSVLFAAFPKFLKPGPTFKAPNADTRLDLVLLALLGLIFSCWFRFHFLLQDFLRDYPSIAADNINRSAFVVRFIPNNVPTSNGVAILQAAEAIVRQELSRRSWVDEQRWLSTIPAQAPIIGSRALTEAFKDAPNAQEAELWRFNAVYSRSIPTNLLQLQAIWTGPSSQANGYVLQKSCAISEAPVQQFAEGTQGNPLTTTPLPYRMDCSRIESSAPGVNAQEPTPITEQAGNFLERLFNAVKNLMQGFVNLLNRMLGVGREGY